MHLAIYESTNEDVKRAIEKYETVDELKDFRDQAMAVELYAKQASNWDLENKVAKVRVRAERKCGELLRDMEKAKGGNIKGANQYSEGKEVAVEHGDLNQNKTLAEMGVTKDQSSKWQKLAAVPEEEFEAAINIPGAKPSTNHIIKKEATSPPRMSDDALWWWGILRQIRARGVMKNPMSELTEEWTEAMTNDADSIISKLNHWVK